jgi:hypothetical protein
LEFQADAFNILLLANRTTESLDFGRWEGNTFVVETVGMDERTWLDQFGHPVSEDMRLVERYRRLDRDTLELNMTITAPMAYTKPWVSETKVMKLAPAGREIQELFCVPSEEMRFNELVRLPAAWTRGKQRQASISDHSSTDDS